MLQNNFFAKDATIVAQKLLGKIIRVKHKIKNQIFWLSAQIIETESYYFNEKGSHSSLGFTDKRKALFMPPGTIYMYYARGGDSLNVSCLGEGNAVLIKSAFPFLEDSKSPQKILTIMQQLNPQKNSSLPRVIEKLCSGQTLLCKSLGLKVPNWDAKQFVKDKFYIEDVGIVPVKIIQTTRLGIPKGRDEHLMYRFVDYAKAKYCTKNPLNSAASPFFILEK